MEEGKKKMIMIVIIVACFAAAGIITYVTRSGSIGGIETIRRGAAMVWLKCRNPDCEHEWQMDRRDYLEYLREQQPPTPITAPAIICPKCSEESGYRAEKCENCGLIFERGSVPRDFPDRCPKCGHSKTERIRKEARSGE